MPPLVASKQFGWRNALFIVLGLFHICGMERFAPEPSRAAISSAILDAPGWARVGITMPNDRLREQAAEELARAIVDRLHQAESGVDKVQLTLAI